MVVVGYDEASASFLLYNSWGKDWGTAGYIRIKFTDFAHFCKYAFIVQLPNSGSSVNTTIANKETFPLREMQGYAQLNFLQEVTAQGEPLFQRVSLRSAGDGLYTCTDGSWSLGQLFQLSARAETQGLYLYAFSIDAQQQTQIHWPRKEAWNVKFDGRNESALLFDSRVPIIIPGPQKALRLSTPGTDAMYLLFATKPIKHLNFIIAKLKQHQGNYRARLEALFGRHLVPLSDIVFSPAAARFEVQTRSQGYIIPIIVTVRGEAG